jgi:hypothetical protein
VVLNLGSVRNCNLMFRRNSLKSARCKEIFGSNIRLAVGRLLRRRLVSKRSVARACSLNAPSPLDSSSNATDLTARRVSRQSTRPCLVHSNQRRQCSSCRRARHAGCLGASLRDSIIKSHSQQRPRRLTQLYTCPARRRRARAIW